MSTRKKLVMRMDSGLGNQMFIYANGYSLAKKNNADMYMDLYRYSLGLSPSHYQLDLYSISCNRTLNLPFKRPARLALLRKVQKRLLGLRNRLCYNYIYELLFAQYQKIELNPKRNNYLTGYWQSPKYFSDLRDDLKNEFTLKEIRPEVSAKATTIREANLCAVHVRRGDYLTFFGGSLSDKYYEEAISLVKKDNPDAQFLFFSDDIEYCISHFSHLENTLFIEQSYKPHEEMYLMSQCKEIIIANSTFSWWGAFLSNATRIICPLTKMWTKDFYLEDWEGIEAEMLPATKEGLKNLMQ